MQYTKLGNTGLEVSRICLGCMSFGDPGSGSHEWTMTEEASRPIIAKALELGVNFFDTANAYSLGSSEEILGKAMADFARRDEVVIATKVWGEMRPGPNGHGLSRKAIMSEVDASLTRLGTDYIDIYQIHRWDYTTPIEESMEALHDIVKQGKARYIGASSMYAWQFSKAQYLAQMNGWTRFVSMQDHYNLIYREEEREMFPLCKDMGVAVLPWSPLARGRLARRWDESTDRSETDQVGKALYQSPATDREVVECLGRVATRLGKTRAQVALAWVLRNPVVTSPIVGARSISHLEEAVAALDIGLPDTEFDELCAPYVPHGLVAFE